MSRGDGLGGWCRGRGTWFGFRCLSECVRRRCGRGRRAQRQELWMWCRRLDVGFHQFLLSYLVSEIGRGHPPAAIIKCASPQTSASESFVPVFGSLAASKADMISFRFPIFSSDAIRSSENLVEISRKRCRSAAISGKIHLSGLYQARGLTLKSAGQAKRR